MCFDMQNIRFGEMESKALFALEEREAGIITLGQLAAMLRLTHVQAWGLASRLVRKHRLIRLKRGTYLFAPMKAGPKGEWSEDALGAVPKLMEGREYYVGFWAALSHYGLTEQIPLNIQLVTRGQQRHFRALQTSFEFVQVRRLGEWKMEKIGAHDVKMATVEQLILDCLSMPEKCGGVKMACQAIWTAQEKVDWKKLETLASKSNDAVRRRLGYVCELLNVRKMKPGRLAGWRWLDPSAKKQALAKSEKWGLVLNVGAEQLMEWRET